jgi:DNA uptake protein ComE-like DNA-binding protein
MQFLRLVALAWALALLPFAPAQTTAPNKPAAAAAQSDLIDINSASEDTLKTVPGIGDAYAKKIVAGRPYKGKNELVSKRVLPQGVYNKVKDRLIARQK